MQREEASVFYFSIDNDRHQPLVGCMDLLALFMKGKCHGESQSKRRHKATGN
jgi:hypothetical protein